MGNCSMKGTVEVAKSPNSIRIMTDSGNVMVLEGPKLAGEVLVDFPGYGIFGQFHMSSSLFYHEQLLANQLYYLFPRGNEFLDPSSNTARNSDTKCASDRDSARVSSSAALNTVSNLTNGSKLEVLPAPQKGVWRVKLVIDTKQLEEILSEQDNTEALIEKMRMAASSANVIPKKMKSSWSVNLKPLLNHIFKIPIDCQNRT